MGAAILSTTSARVRWVLSITTAPSRLCWRRWLSRVSRLATLVLQALLLAAAGAFDGIGEEEETEIGVGENLRADVAALHHEPAEAVFAGGVGLAALVVEQRGADRPGMAAKRATWAVTSALRISVSGMVWPLSSISALRPVTRVENTTGGEGGLRRRRDRLARDAAAQELGGDGAVVGAGVGVEQVEALAERAATWRTCPRRRRRRWRR